jgi:hypothetical protein
MRKLSLKLTLVLVVFLTFSAALTMSSAQTAAKSAYLYGIDSDGALKWYKQNSVTTGGGAWQGGNKVGSGWNSYQMVFSGGGNTIYGITPDGLLKWHKHLGFRAGGGLDQPGAWADSRTVGRGWNGFSQVFSGGDGVIYTITQNGTLQWRRHRGYLIGAGLETPGAWEGPKDIGRGWAGFRQIFAAGHGVIYTITQDGTLQWRKHNGYLSGAGLETPGAWEGPKDVGRGWTGFRQIFAAGDGVMYTITQNGTLQWRQHKGYESGAGLETPGAWEGPKDIANGLSGSQQVFALLPGSVNEELDKRLGQFLRYSPELKPGQITPAVIPGTAPDGTTPDITVTEHEQELRGLVTISTGCSGVLLTNDWVITAGHCLSVDRNPKTMRISANWGPGGSQERTSDAFYQFGGGLDMSGRDLDLKYGPDLALVHLTQPFTVNGATTGYRNQIYPGSAESLKGKTIATYGRGISIYAVPGTPPTPATGGGTYRAADLIVSTLDPDGYRALPNKAGQITAFGDSGGPGFIWENNVPYLTGINSRVAYNCIDTKDCKNTVTGVTEAYIMSLPALRNWIQAVFTTQWHPTATSEPVYVKTAEIKGTKWDVTDVNQVGWAQANRAAAEMAYNRGFASGHFDGHQDVARGGYGIQVSGRGTIFWEVTRKNIRETPFGFTDINQVNWAQANRAAERLCASANQGYAGGHFTGHMKRGSFDEMYGMVCYKDGAQWFDATAAELNATGWAVGDLNTTPWAQAARAATDYCRKRGFTGGFMNGQQVGDRRGVVCQR